MSEPQRVLVDVRDGIATVSLNRADKHNALDLPMFDALVGAASDLRKLKDLRVVILRGEGPSFCSGLDVGSVLKKPLKMARSFATYGIKHSNVFQQAGLCWRDLPVPVIAAIHGSCYGGGLQIALGADFRIAAADAKLSVMEIKWGLVPDMSGTATLRDLMPLDVAKKLAMTGQIVSGMEALALHLVTEVASDPLAAAQELAATLIGKSPDALGGIKQLFDANWNASVARALALERKIQLRMLTGRNHREAVKANVEKRSPAFQARSFGGS
ncbi:MAG: Enoyl-CoA hydratase/carnithine racemase [Hydrocarboniphaga sp.]|uniref:crotonase/enoyl-CoA hydratase family protein n=1 Tax=Hydrocarboniphaga sp. TaxID=2033016 RepID=UPI00261FB9AE|nr:crotonase/enoyl-CoA hydratase family protein [Hydrocarboniphaga sp.]MDB5969012.1 Enoyl-CoA hydratase/carnithine racemase [Hydrocarboniphaga sp.]